MRADVFPPVSYTHLDVYKRQGYIFPMLQVLIAMDDGGWLELTQPLSITDNRLVWRQRIFVLFESLIFSLIVIILIRCAAKPIERLAQEADRFGRNPEAVSYTHLLTWSQL